MQAVRLGREDEADALLSRELAETLSFAELCDFSGALRTKELPRRGYANPLHMIIQPPKKSSSVR